MRAANAPTSLLLSEMIEKLEKWPNYCITNMRGPRKFFQRGFNFENVFYFYFNDCIRILLKSSHHRPASETPLKWRFAGVPMMAMAFRWRADDGPTLNAGLVAL